MHSNLQSIPRLFASEKEFGVVTTFCTHQAVLSSSAASSQPALGLDIDASAWCNELVPLITRIAIDVKVQQVDKG